MTWCLVKYRDKFTFTFYLFILILSSHLCLDLPSGLRVLGGGEEEKIGGGGDDVTCVSGRSVENPSWKNLPGLYGKII